MSLDIDKDWFTKKAAEEGDLEIGAGGRKTLTVNLRPDEIAILERLVNPEAEKQRARNAELTKAIWHWKQEVGKLHSQIDTLKGQLDEAGRTADARKVVIEQRDARIAALSEENERLREASKAAYMGLLVLKTMCAKKGLTGGVEATESAMRQLTAVIPELPALSALRGSVVIVEAKP